MHPPSPRVSLTLAILKFVIARYKETIFRVVIDSIRWMSEHFCHVPKAAFITGHLSPFDVTNVGHELEIHLPLV